MRTVRALLVDDSATTRGVLVRALGQTGLATFEVVEAGDGVEALTRYRPDETEILFIDFNMPRMGGLELIREIRRRYKFSPPAIMITGETDRAKMNEAIQEPGVSALLRKPVDGERLRAGLKTIIDALPHVGRKCSVPHGDCVGLALTEVLQRACGAELTPSAVEGPVSAREVVLATFAVTGAVNWSIVVGFSPDAALTLAQTFAGVELKTNSTDLGDALAELANITGGRLRLLLASRDMRVSTSPATVVSATNLRILASQNRGIAVAHMNYVCPAGQVWIALSAGVVNGLFL